MPAIYAKYCERGGLPVIRGDDMACGADMGHGADVALGADASCGADVSHGADVSQYSTILTDIYTLASSSDYEYSGCGVPPVR
ncbi:hypothetical protein [Coprococcus catus]|uniref:hypothetical protein n=1 Tax=Coprococcus catus TaxID=116085 RepID=UPI003CFEC99B